MNILITSCSRKVLLVKSFKTHLNNLGGILYTTDINVNSPALYFSDDYFLCPRSDEVKFIDFMLDKCQKYNIKLIIPTSCRELNKFSLNKDKFKNIGCTIMICSKKSLEICQNKKKFVEFCFQENFPIPKTYDSAQEIEKYPVFCKPIDGKGSFGILKILNEREIKNVDFKKYVVQEFVNWDEYTVDYLSDFDGNYINSITRKRTHVVNGESIVSEVENIKEIRNITTMLAKKLHLIGHNTIQCFWNGISVKIIEVNPRFGGASNLSINAGLNSPKILINLMHKTFDKNMMNNDNNLMMLRYSKDIFGYLVDGQFKSKNLSERGKIYCVDIDGTICTEQCEYEDAMPINKTINIINKLYENNKIILFTSRGYTSKKDWSSLTKSQLKKWGVKYNELCFGKPYADYYIDNKAIDILEWI